MSEQNNAGTNPKLQEFFVNSLEEMYWAETHLVSVLTTMSKAATDPTLKQAFDLHSQQTTQHRDRLDKVFNLLNLPAKSAPSIGLQGLFNEGWQVIDGTEDGSALRDVALIVAAQKFEHYEIACYGSLITLAKTIGENEVAKILVPTLNEEKDNDASLTAIAEAGVNEDAVEEKPKKAPAKKVKTEAQEVNKSVQGEITDKPKKSSSKTKSKVKSKDEVS